MNKMMVSIFVICFLLSTIPISIVGEAATKEETSSANESLQHDFSEDSYKNEHVPGELIVKFKEPVSFSLSPDGSLVTGVKSLDDLNRKYGVISAVEVIKNNYISSLSNIYKLVFAKDVNIPSLADEYASDSSVAYAEPNYIYKLCTVPNDPHFGQQWGLDQANDCDIDAPEAWDIETGNPDVTIAIIDSGVDYNHPDLANNIWGNNDEIPNNGIDDDHNGFVDDVRGWDFCNNDNDPMDEYGHGTHCAGIASAVTNNGVGIAGVCWNCKIMPIRIGNDGIEMDAAVAGIIYAADNGADVISMSWGGYIFSQILLDALEYAFQKGVVLVAAAGNDGNDLDHYPAGYNCVISVAATDSNDGLADFSDYGFWVDIGAPGVDIYSTLPGNSYDIKSGTSMSCPFVAGLAALLFSKDNSLTNEMVKTMVCGGFDDIGTELIRGRINAFKTIQLDPVISLLDYTPEWRYNAKGAININGHAWAENFQSYVLEYGTGKYPTSWTTIKNSNDPQDGLLTSLDTTDMNEGFYLIRLRVICVNGDEFSDTIPIMVNNHINTVHVDGSNSQGPWDGTPEHPFEYVQDGIDNAGIDDTILVHKGTYTNSLLINCPSIALLGEDRNETILRNDYNMKPIIIDSLSNNVKISNFTFRYSDYPIFIYGDFSKVTDNTIYGTNHYSICLLSSNSIIKGNILDGRGNSMIGILLVPGVTNNVVTDNIVSNYCNYGISVGNDANNNHIYHNYLIGTSAFDGSSLGFNIWDNSYPSGGNYWEDYNGVDEYSGENQNIPGSDGIGDTPYAIQGQGLDHYPFMCRPSQTTINGPNSGKTGAEYQYTFNSTNPDDNQIYYYIDWGDGNTVKWDGPHNSGEEVTFSHIWTKKGKFLIRACAKNKIIYDYGFTSDWGKLKVTMPRNRITDNLVIRFLGKLPLFEKIFSLINSLN